MTAQFDKRLTSREAAEFLNVAQQTLQNWRSKGIGPEYETLGQNKKPRVRYRLSVLEQYLKSK